jgi:uncharacterized protein YjbJ (UPF0337 family)
MRKTAATTINADMQVRSKAPSPAASSSQGVAPTMPASMVPAKSSTKGHAMNWDTIEGNWKQFKGHVKEKWGNLTNDHLETIAGKRDRLAGRIQQTYGITVDQAERLVKGFEKRWRSPLARSQDVTQGCVDQADLLEKVAPIKRADRSHERATQFGNSSLHRPGRLQCPGQDQHQCSSLHSGFPLRSDSTVDRGSFVPSMSTNRRL